MVGQLGPALWGKRAWPNPDLALREVGSMALPWTSHVEGGAAHSLTPTGLHGRKGVWPSPHGGVLSDGHGLALTCSLGFGILATGKGGSINYHCSFSAKYLNPGGVPQFGFQGSVGQRLAPLC